MTEFAHAKGHYGIEIVTGILNYYFEKLSEVIYACGGDILKYGGDSCLIFFSNLHDTSRIRKLCNAVETVCAELNTAYHKEYGFGFGVHGGVTTGKYWLNIVGSEEYHWDYYVHSPQLQSLYELIGQEHHKGLVYLFPETELAAASVSDISEQSVAQERFLPSEVTGYLQGSDIPAELRNAVVVFLHLSPVSGQEIPIDTYQNYFLEVQRWVYEFGGVVNKIDFTEKGYMILLLFGVPFAHMDDIERAFLCARRIVNYPDKEIHCRIGITHSNIYCGFIGSTKRWEYGIIGNAVNVAARLLNFAQSSQIALTEEIVPVIESRFTVKYIESSYVRGIKEPIKVYLLDRELPEHWAQHQKVFSKLPYVLGASIQEILMNFASSEQAQMLSVIGSQGMGKSFLIWLISNLCNEQGKSVEVSVADKSRQFLRLEFFFNLLRRKLGITSFRNEFHVITKHARDAHLDWNDKLLFRYLFPRTESIASVSKEETELAIACITNFCFDLLSSCNVFAVDNLDDYDVESLKIISRLSQLFLASGVKVLFSSRVEGKLYAPDGFKSDTISLSNLKYNQSDQIIADILPLVSKAAKALIHKISFGNPQLLVALLMHIKGFEDVGNDLITESTIKEWQDRGIITGSLENLLMSEYQAMPIALRHLLKLISIYGKPFTVNEISSIYQLQNQEDLFCQVNQLVKLQILELYNRGGNPVYAYANPLLQDCIYRSILLGEKRSLHLLIAKAFVQNTERHDELMQSIVHHFVQADDIDGILHWATIAAQRCFHAGAWNASKLYFRILSEKSPDQATRTMSVLKMVEVCINLADNTEALILLDALPQLDGYQREYFIYLKSLYLNNIADYASLQQYLKDNLQYVKDTDLRALTKNVYLESLLYSNNLKPLFSEALKIYPKLKDAPVLQNKLAGIIAQAYMNQSKYQKAATYYRQKLAIAEQLADGLSLRIACNGLGTALSRMGKKDEAYEYYQQALSISERDGDRNGYAKVLLNLGVHHRNVVEYDKAIECYEKSLLLSRHIGNLMQESITLFDIGELLFHQSKFSEAKDYIQQSLDLAIRINDYSGVSFCRDALGDLFFKSGDIDEAERTYLENLKLQRRIHDTEGIAHTVGNLGNIAKSRKNYPEARRMYKRQLQMELQISDYDGAGRACFNLAMINKEQNMYKRALYQLHKAIEMFSKCNAQYYLDICKQQEIELVSLLES